MRHRLAIAAAALLLLAGCSDDSPEPSASPSTSRPTASPSPTGPVAPVLPEAAKGVDDVAQKEFIRFYFEALSHAMTTGDTTAIDQYGAKDCEACRNFSRRAHSIYDQGGRISGGGWVVDEIHSTQLSTEDIPVYGVAFHERAKVLWDDEGTRVDRDPETRAVVTVWISRAGPSWTVREIQAIQKAGN